MPAIFNSKMEATKRKLHMLINGKREHGTWHTGHKEQNNGYGDVE